MPEPSTSLAITLHSICHPGRPGPHGESHAGSPGFDDFQSAKSAEDRFPVVLVKDPGERLLAQSCSHARDQRMTGSPSPSSSSSRLPLLQGCSFA